MGTQVGEAARAGDAARAGEAARAGDAAQAGDAARAGEARRSGWARRDPETLVAAARAGDPRALARLVSLVEDASPLLRPIMRIVAPMTGHAHVVGLTGSPGVGKSTVTGALVRAYRDRGQQVGVLAVDPSSPFSGGALLGDRVRMQEHATDDAVFIRSMASRGHLGGLASATPQALRILDSVGFDLVLVETVGVGQAEVEIAALADTALVVVAPGLGDSIQAAKAGILEIADLFAVNKSDRPGAHEVTRDLRSMLAMASYGQQDWKPPIIATAAVTGDGIGDLVAALDRHRDWLAATGHLQVRRRARARNEISAIAMDELRRRAGDMPGRAGLDELADQVCAGKLDPYAAADDLIGAAS